VRINSGAFHFPRRASPESARQATTVEVVGGGKVPKFIDAHDMKPFTADELNKLQAAAPDEFGVTHHDILFSEGENKIYCVLDAPNAEAIHKHHAKAGIKCDWVHEVKSTRG
jgi:hypothetical protein